ncbi:MAG: LytTR family transcriptional regulator DNA-binding domain-containing protein [Oscillospiraceae bacterium]|nr:LytTR family transcriptional regulator DNA-binding domain-containing protein [Oscillospiraceae bacterium]
MNYKVIIDSELEEDILVYANKKTKLIKDIEELILNERIELIGFKEKESIVLNLSEIYCFIVENNKIYASTIADKLQLKYRLYQLEEKLPENFIKINKSCIANIKLIEKFNSSFSGTLVVKFKNGYTDYVSRRNLKNIKERFAL